MAIRQTTVAADYCVQARKRFTFGTLLAHAWITELICEKTLDVSERFVGCGGLHVTRYEDVQALLVETSDMGTEERFAYQLGDRLYFTRDEAIASTDLPCGARAIFDSARMCRRLKPRRLAQRPSRPLDPTWSRQAPSEA